MGRPQSATLAGTRAIVRRPASLRRGRQPRLLSRRHGKEPAWAGRTAPARARANAPSHAQHVASCCRMPRHRCLTTQTRRSQQGSLPALADPCLCHRMQGKPGQDRHSITGVVVTRECHVDTDTPRSRVCTYTTQFVAAHSSALVKQPFHNASVRL